VWREIEAQVIWARPGLQTSTKDLRQ
jgi:hypothetical protein